MDTIAKTKDLSQLSICETDLGRTVCGKAARTGLWGSGKVTSRSTRKRIDQFSYIRVLKVN